MSDHPALDENWQTRIAAAKAVLAAAAPHLSLNEREAMDKFFAGVEQMAEEAEEDDQLRGQLAALLTGVALGLKGKPAPLHLHDWSDLPSRAEALCVERNALAAQLADIKRATGALSIWWAMLLAQEELAGAEIKDDATVLHFMGSGASTTVTAGQLNAMCNAIYGAKPCAS